MTGSDLVQKAIWGAAHQRLHPGKRTYMPLSEASLTAIATLVKKTIEFLELYTPFKDSIYSSAKLIEKAGDAEQHFQHKTSAILSLETKSIEAVAIATRQTDVKKAVLNKLWTDELLLAAGRLMRDVSMGVDHDPRDVGIVDEAKRRAPLLLAFTNKVALGIEGNPDRLDPIDRAMQLAPAQPPIIWKESKHPLMPVDDDLTTFFKTGVTKELWTTDVLLAAGKIAAARSLHLKPSWTDVETTSQADRVGRIAVLRLQECKQQRLDLGKEFIFSRDMIPEVITEAITQARQREKEARDNRPIDEAVHYEIQRKVSQYIWISFPDLSEARGNFIKHGNYYTPHGDVLLVQAAWRLEHRLIQAVCELLKEKEVERINAEPSSFITWLWGNHASASVKPKIVSPRLSNKITKSENEEVDFFMRWFTRNAPTLTLDPEDVTHDLIDEALKRSLEIQRKSRERELEEEAKKISRNTPFI